MLLEFLRVNSFPVSRVDRLYAGAGRPLPRELDEALDAGRLPLNHCLDRAIPAVSHPAGEAELPGVLDGPGTIPDALHAAANREVTCDDESVPAMGNRLMITARRWIWIAHL